jgi:hypothetical protein
MVQFIFHDEDFRKPFFVTYLSTATFSLHLLVVGARLLWQRCRPATVPATAAAAGDGNGDEDEDEEGRGVGDGRPLLSAPEGVPLVPLVDAGAGPADRVATAAAPPPFTVRQVGRHWAVVAALCSRGALTWVGEWAGGRAGGRQWRCLSSSAWCGSWPTCSPMRRCNTPLSLAAPSSVPRQVRPPARPPTATLTPTFPPARPRPCARLRSQVRGCRWTGFFTLLLSTLFLLEPLSVAKFAVVAVR